MSVQTSTTFYSCARVLQESAACRGCA